MDPINVTTDADRFTCNAHLVPGETTTLVDAGRMPGVVDVVREHVDAVDRVILTHGHGDHVDRLDAVLDAFDADLYAYADRPRRDVALSDGDAVTVGDEDCEVVHTPGHAPDHVAFVGDRRLYSGDVVVYNDAAFDDGSFGRTDIDGASREELIESLETLLDRTPDSVSGLFAGHGDPFHGTADGDSVRDVVERALERAKRREPKYPDG
jgi:glyoxylase-like metal-dependent hydrolase (beta-lactamase superfamily II)